MGEDRSSQVAEAATPTFLTTREAAQLARVAPKTIRAWVQARRLTGHWAGKRLLRIRADEMVAFLANGSNNQPEQQETAEEIAGRVLGARKWRC